MKLRWSKTLIVLLGGFWLWHALTVVAATGGLDPTGRVMGTFYLENLLSLYVPPLLVALLIYLQRRKSHAAN